MHNIAGCLSPLRQVEEDYTFLPDAHTCNVLPMSWPCNPKSLEFHKRAGLCVFKPAEARVRGAQVVREGRPCHLYFDLEFVPACNPGVDGDLMVTLLLDLIRRGLRCAGVRCGLSWSQRDTVPGFCKACNSGSTQAEPYTEGGGCCAWQLGFEHGLQYARSRIEPVQDIDGMSLGLAQRAVGPGSGGRLGVGAGEQQRRQVEPPPHRARAGGRLRAQPGHGRVRAGPDVPAPGEEHSPLSCM